MTKPSIDDVQRAFEESNLTPEMKNIGSILIRIWYVLGNDKFGGPFISGEFGKKDSVGLPENILVCPAEGLDGFCVYTKNGEYTAPEW